MRLRRTASIFAMLTMVLLCSSSPVFPAGSSVTQAVTNIDGSWGGTAFRILTFTCTADDTDGSFPSTDVSAANTALILGWQIDRVETDPGTTAPTAAWDATLKDANGYDVMGAQLADRSATATEMAFPPTASAPVLGTLTLAIINNSVNDATIIIKVILSKEGYR